MDKPAPKKRASRLSEDRRQQIFSAVIESVTTVGYEQTSFEGIAAATTSSKATLYRHWHDKPSLVVTAFAATDAIDVASIDTGNLAGDLEQFMDMLAVKVDRNINVMLTLAEAGRRDPALRHALARVAVPDLTALRTIVDAAIARGEITSTERTVHLRELLTGVFFDSVLFGGDSAHLSPEYLRNYLHSVILPLLGLPG